MVSPARARWSLLLLASAIALQLGVFLVLTIHVQMKLQADRLHGFHPGSTATVLAFTSLPVLVVSPLSASLIGSTRSRVVMGGVGTISTSLLVLADRSAEIPLPTLLAIWSLLAVVFLGTGARRFIAACRPAKVRTTLAVALAGILCFTVLRAIAYLTFNWFESSPKDGLLFPTEVLALSLLAVLAAILAPDRNEGDTSLPKGIIRPFLAGFQDAMAHRLARHSILGFGAWSFLTGSILWLLIPLEMKRELPTARMYLLFLTGLIIGGVAFGINLHSYRCGWAIPYASVIVVCHSVWIFRGDSIEPSLLWLGLALGASLPALVHYAFLWTKPGFHGVTSGLLAGAGAIGLAGVLAVAVSCGSDAALARPMVARVFLVVSLTAMAAAWLGFFRPAMEGTIEAILWPVYRIRAHGPGASVLPDRGPYLVIANHSAWLDPLFLAKILPPPTIPMMTSKFYDLPVISWLMRRVIGTIRVPEVPYRHEAPELQEAVAALDRGECVVLFPEGYLRRKEDQPLRRFGRGVWKILSERPATPVFACWIEGNWGSFFSHRGGPPIKGKKPDFWRSIRIGVLGPIHLEPERLADHLTTRADLMGQVAAARLCLGLDPIEYPLAASEEDRA